MCRWLAYSGSPILLTQALYTPAHSLVDQSLHSRTDGHRTWAVRYSTEGKSRSLYFTAAVPELRKLYPDDPRTHGLSDDMRVIVSEPLGDLPGVWNEVPESTCGIVTGGDNELRPFRPKAPALVAPV